MTMKCPAAFILLAVLCNGEHLDHKNRNDITALDKEMKALQENLKEDLQSLQAVANLGHSERSQLYDYIDRSIANVKGPLQEALQEIQNNTATNMKRIEESMRFNFEQLQAEREAKDTAMIQAIDSALLENTETLQAHDKSIEDIVSSRLAVCAHKLSNKIPGPVHAFDSILHRVTSNTKKTIQILGGKFEANDVFDIHSGTFTVPKGGSGEYWISVSILLDVFGWHHQLAGPAFVMSKYRLLIDGQDVLPEAVLFSDAGTSENADLVQASRSIILHLKEDQELTLKKMVTTHPTASPDTETDKRLTFCISLNHLDAALELGALSTAKVKSSPIAPETWNYTAPVLQDFANIKDIEPLAQPEQADLPVIRQPSTPQTDVKEVVDTHVIENEAYLK